MFGKRLENEKSGCQGRRGGVIAAPGAFFFPSLSAGGTPRGFACWGWGVVSHLGRNATSL